MKIFRNLTKVVLAGLLFGGVLTTALAEAPSLTLKDSIPLAEQALAKTKVVLSNYYIYSITYANSSKGNYWYYTYRAFTPSERNGIFVKVYMDATVEVTAPEEN